MADMNVDGHGVKLDSLRNLRTESSPTKLEAGLEAGVRLLADIKAAFADANSVGEIAELSRSIDELLAKSCKQRTVVGVVGSTGAGKSSLINAILNEENLVPTNSMRACTASITEIQYNESDNKQEAYRAEIQFISAEEWLRELQVLYDDLKGTGDSQPGHESIGGGQSTRESGAAIAYDKIRCVYPGMLKEKITRLEFTPKGLAEDPSVKNLLGTVKQISAASSKVFMKRLKVYIDSKDRSGGRSKKEEERMEYWPLIKAVRVYVKSPVLEPGLVLVDLPGVEDSNAARSAVAARYIEECTGLWIVAPITRAVDDKVAQKLMGTSFKRQLQFDGAYSAMTVICSKADDISITEVLRSIPQDHQVHSDNKTIRVLESHMKQVKKEMSPLSEQSNKLRGMSESCENTIEALEIALEEADGDQDLVRLPADGSTKRKPRAATSNARKRIKKEVDSEDSEDSDDSEVEDGSEDELDGSEYDEVEDFVSRDVAEQRLESLRLQKRSYRQQRLGVQQKMKPLQTKLDTAQREIELLKAQVKSGCIQYRNQYSRPVIQRQFAEGVRELDLDNASVEDVDNPSYEGRNYNEIAEQLPVFCVSSRAYQKMSGMLKRDEPTTGFLSIEDTEIPALQQHAMSIVSKVRSATCRKFLADLYSFITSLVMQIVIAEKPLKLADAMKEHELAFLNRKVKKLSKSLTYEVEKRFRKLQHEFDHRIIAKVPDAVRHAADTAATTVQAWGKPRAEGGLHYMTYRATCARQGEFTGTSGEHDFNDELCEPLLRQLAPSWEKVFAEKLPSRITRLGSALASTIPAFVDEMHKRRQLKDSPSYELVRQHVKTLEEGLRDTSGVIYRLKIGGKQASRLFKPPVKEAMKPVYSMCINERGFGCWNRMKKLMREHIEEAGFDMFEAATKAVGDSLQELLNDIHSDLEKNISQVTDQITDDYKSLVLDRDIFKALESSRNAVKALLQTADDRFLAVLSASSEASPAPATASDVVTGLGSNRNGLAVPKVSHTPRQKSPFTRSSILPSSPLTPATHAGRQLPSDGLQFTGGVSKLTLASPAPSAGAASTPIKKER